ncbi:MAG: site-specific integrase [Deltaproteobacteria bacterium]|nr:site-specific integrase [Deltaproteobacteria bacterium]
MVRFFRTKNKRERTEFLMPQSKQELQEWLAHQEWMRKRKKISPNGSRLIFSHLNGTPILRFDNAWRKACRLAGIEDFHFHYLRHTFCSNLLLSGSDLKDAKDMIGHSDIAMTDRYTHLALQRKIARQEELAEHYWNGKSSGEDIRKIEQEIGQKQQKGRKS